MATLSTFSSSLHSIPRPNSQRIHSHSLSFLHFQSHGFSSSFNNIILKNTTKGRTSFFHGIRKLKSLEEDTQISEEAQVEEQPEQQQTVSVPVSPSDTLTMFFQAEGTMNETAIPTVTKALEGSEGITDLKVQVQEGIASVELTKQTTAQATGVASSLVELIQGSGFKLQTLNLSFADEEDALV
ncbi:uncharacterized protein LOC8280574 [Ricinus communis]|uniref:uncharacterized protein LOC8280574 n=1 Tax=Ricinus communis TaxID=3988 RepID=UPI0007726937|nr:uncharacterized protein LOC8280574 [Ricinus communis]|eukprot:XP_015573628.1 uncharacterized protein LOC8280574 [Ricinus communis]